MEANINIIIKKENGKLFSEFSVENIEQKNKYMQLLQKEIIRNLLVFATDYKDKTHEEVLDYSTLISDLDIFDVKVFEYLSSNNEFFDKKYWDYIFNTIEEVKELINHNWTNHIRVPIWEWVELRNSVMQLLDVLSIEYVDPYLYEAMHDIEESYLDIPMYAIEEHTKETVK